MAISWLFARGYFGTETKIPPENCVAIPWLFRGYFVANSWLFRGYYVAKVIECKYSVLGLCINYCLCSWMLTFLFCSSCNTEGLPGIIYMAAVGNPLRQRAFINDGIFFKLVLD